MVAKIFTAVQRFAPNPIWNFDTIHRILIDSGNYVGADIITSISRLLIHTSSIQSHAVRQLSGSLMNFSDNQTLMQVSAWVIGEFSTTDDGSYENLKQLMTIPQTNDITKGYIITALAKLAVRFNKKQETVEFLKTLSTANNLDVQQRAGEMIILLCNQELCDEVLAPVECDAQESALIVDSTGANEQEDDLLIDIGGSSKPTAPVKASNPIDDLLGIATPAPAQQAQVQQQVPAQQPVAQPRPNPGSIEALRKTDYVIYFEIRKNPQDPRQMAIRASIFGLGKSPLNNFSVKYGVPVGWLLKASAPSANKLEPVGGAPIVQQLLLSTQADIKLMMKVQVQYMYGSQPITEQGEINPIFN